MRRTCPHCDHHRAWELADGRYRGRRCRHADTFQSVWTASRLRERGKTRLLESCVLEVPAYRLRFRGPASQAATKRFVPRIRSLLSLAEDCREPFGGEIDCDETSCGGWRPAKRGWGAAGKVIVLGLLPRNGRVRTFPVRRNRRTFLRLVQTHTTPGSLDSTDE